MVDEKQVTKKTEGALVFGGAILESIATFVAAIPIPVEWKAPISALTATVGTATLGYWYAKINNQVKE